MFTIDTAAVGFSKLNASGCAVASLLAYSQAPTIANGATNTQLLVLELENAIVIAFRGTQEPKDFVTDIKFWRNDHVHFGFFTAINSVIDAVVDRVAKLPDKPIFITGHSLGGALALLCAHYFTLKRIPVHSVYTFGQPRVSDEPFALEYDTALGSRTYRLVHKEDIVPRLPGIISGYRHAGRCMFLTSIGGCLMEPPIYLKLASDAFGLWAEYKQGKIALLADHKMEGYFEAVSAL